MKKYISQLLLCLCLICLLTTCGTQQQADKELPPEPITAIGCGRTVEVQRRVDLTNHDALVSDSVMAAGKGPYGRTYSIEWFAFSKPVELGQINTPKQEFVLTNSIFEQGLAFTGEQSINLLLLDHVQVLQDFGLYSTRVAVLKANTACIPQFTLRNSQVDTAIVSKNSTYGVIKISNNARVASILSEADTIGTLSYEGTDRRGRYSFKQAVINDLHIKHQAPNHASWELVNSIISGQIDFSKAYMPSRLNFSQTVLPSKIDLRGVYGASSIDFSQAKYYKDRIIDLHINTVDSLDLKMDYSYFQLVLDSSLNSLQKDNIYKYLLKQQKAYDFQDGYKKLFIEYQEHRRSTVSNWCRWIENKLSELWWDYGLTKSKVLRATLCLLGLCFVVNLIMCKSLLSQEPIKKLTQKYSRSKPPFLVLYITVLYFFYAFDFRAEYSKLRVSILLLAQTVIGKICLIYIVTYIFA